MQKFLDYFNNLSEQARYASVVFVVFLVILLDVLFFLLPQITDINNVNDKIKKLSDDTQQVLIDRQRTNVLKKNLQGTRGELSSLTSKVRTLQEVPAIDSTIASIANEYGVKIDQLDPERSSQELLASSPDGKYYALPVVIKARCGYHKFGYFLNKLENQDLYFILKDFIIQNDDKDPSVRLFSLTIDLVLVDRSAGQSKSL